MDTLIQWGMPIVLWLQSLRTPLLDGLMGGTYYLGTEDFFILCLPVVFWCLHKSLGIRLSLVVIFSSYVNLVVKDILATPRPWQVDGQLYAPFQTAGYGMPSGHAQSAVAFWGYLATQLKRPGWWALAIFMSLWIGVERIYVGDHFPQDVLLGWALGIAIVAAMALLQAPVTAWLSRQSLAPQIGLGALIPLGLFALHPTADTAKMTGLLLGLFALFPIEEKFIRFDTNTTLLKQLVKFVLGVAVLLAIRLGLKAVFPEQMIFDLLRYAAMGAWAALGAPWVFVKMGLARQIAAQPMIASASTIKEA